MSKNNNSDNLETLQEGLMVDKDSLDDEFISHPSNFYTIAAAYETAIMARDSCKIDIEQTEAELYIQFNRKAEEQEGRVTDTSIKRQVTSSKRMIELEKTYLRLKEKAGKLGAMKEAYQQKGYALNKLADLYIANYFTTESGGKQRSEAKDNIAERNRKEAGELRRKKRGEN